MIYNSDEYDPSPDYGNTSNNEENIINSPETNEVSNKKPVKDISINIQLGDVIKIYDPQNENLNNIFFVDYIDSHKIILLNVDNLSKIELPINEDKTIANNTIRTISILSRSENIGYAKQNGLLPGTWINIYFGGVVPLVITGEITNLEEDMIEIKTYPDNSVIYINFDYKGIPEDIPIENIEIRTKPESTEEIQELLPEIELIPEEPEVEFVEKPIEYTGPVKVIKDQIREFILKADQIQFGNEEFGPITQFIDVDVGKQRYSIEDQTNHLLDDLLSTIPNYQRTSKVLNNIHTMIERFKQLRKQFSNFDDFGNIKDSKINQANWKPLTEYFKKFNKLLYWILPVVKNIKKLYDIPENDDENLDVQLIQTSDDIEKISNIINTYKSNNLPLEQNKYVNLFTELNPYFTPFDYINPESANSIIYDKLIETDIIAIIDNLTDFYSSVAQNNSIKSSRFVISKYNLGLTKLDATNLSGNRMISQRVVLNNPDLLETTSFMMLPEPTVRFSRINLPNTSILDRSNLNCSFLNYWQLFHPKTNVTNLFVDNINNEVVFDEENFLSDIKNFVLNISDQDKFGYTRYEIYEKFINSIIPTTRILFNLVKKYIKGKLSIVEVVNYLEPFLVYTDDLTYKQYQNIVTFINGKILEYNKQFPEKHRLFLNIKTKVKSRNELSFQAFSIVNMLTQSNNLRESILDSYDFNDLKGEIYQNSEILRKLVMKDYGNLYYSALSLESAPLMYSNDIENIINIENDKLQQSETENKCKKYIVAKQYISEDELLSDNNVDIYFDKKFDNTKYGLLDDYNKEMVTMSSDDFINFLIKKLKIKLKLNEEDAEYLADTLINGVKKVLDGHYAIIYKINSSNETNMFYYIRKNNKWELDDTVDKDLFTGNQNILCNFQEKCISIPDNIEEKCENIKNNEIHLKEDILKDIMDEFDLKYKITKEEFEAKMKAQMEYYQEIIPMITQIEFNNLLKYNYSQYKLGLNLNEEKPIIISPYFKLRDIILGQQDFIKKQQDIIRFVSSFTREPHAGLLGPTGEEESIHWLYCVETNVKLLPSFIYYLASVFINNYDNYNNAVDKIIQENGTLSDDGDSWVDKYSGYIIKKIDFDVEEGYEEGFKIKSRDIIEQDVGDNITTLTKKTIKYESPESKIISNVLTALSISMGISIDNQWEFIINNVINTFQELIPSEASYKKRIQEMANKGKSIPSFKEQYNSLILYLTLGMFLIGVQTSIPSVKTRKTFPGCIRSFDGYPFEGAGDLSSLNYISCIVFKIKSPIDPWSVLSRKKEADISSKIKEMIDKFLLNLPDVKRKIEEKTEYLLVNPVDEISQQHSINNWTQFLPPLLPFKIKKLNPITPEFKNILNQDLKSGANTQREKILIVESKIIQFSLSIQEKIQNVINKEKLLLTTSANEPFLENACCSEKGDYSTIRYFEKHTGDIMSYNDIVYNLTGILYDINSVTEAILFSNKINTKNIFPTLSNNFNEETIYLAFINYCHFNSLLPVSENLLPLCSEKPEFLKENDSINEMIRKLKNDGRNYNNETFLRLLQIIGRENIVNINIDLPVITTIQKFRDTVESIDFENDSLIDNSLKNLFNKVMDTFDIASNIITPETKSLNNYLIKTNETLKNNIIDFIKINGNTSKKDIKMFEKFLNDLMVWEGDKNIRKQDYKISEESLYNSIHFFKSYIKNFIEVFPNIILNKVDYQDTNIPRYWGLSDHHSMNIKKIISEYYVELKKLYNDNTLNNVLNNIYQSSKNIFVLSQDTPSYSSIKYNTKEIKPIFDEKTSKLLYEFYFLKTIQAYINLTDDENMIVREIKKQVDVDELFTVDYLDETVGVEPAYNTQLVKGNKKELRQKVSSLLLMYVKIMNNHKEDVNTSYDIIMDRVFKLKEKEKDLFTDRLQNISDEERNVDTILKINKLGVWSKGLQKGLTTYVKENYDEELEFMNKMNQYENVLRAKNKNVNDQNIEQYMEDYMEEIDNEMDIENEAYDISNMTEDYDDGNFESDEIERDEYDDYY
jgi:hypothetical protein